MDTRGRCRADRPQASTGPTVSARFPGRVQSNPRKSARAQKREDSPGKDTEQAERGVRPRGCEGGKQVSVAGTGNKRQEVMENKTRQGPNLGRPSLLSWRELGFYGSHTEGLIRSPWEAFQTGKGLEILVH